MYIILFFLSSSKPWNFSTTHCNAMKQCNSVLLQPKTNMKTKLMEKKYRRKPINITNNLSLQNTCHPSSDWWGCNLHLLSPTMVWFTHHAILLLCTKLGGMVCFGAAMQWHCRINKWLWWQDKFLLNYVRQRTIPIYVGVTNTPSL